MFGSIDIVSLLLYHENREGLDTMISTKTEVENEGSETDEDPVLQMLGVGKQLWEDESGDAFVDRLRSEEMPSIRPQSAQPNQAALQSAVWKRMQDHQGSEFRTVRGLPFTYKVEGAGIWFFRGGRRIERKLTRTQINVAISRCPLTTTTEIKDLMDYAYLFALLRDPRIRSRDW